MRNFFFSPQPQFCTLKEALPQSQFRNLKKMLLRNSASATISEVRNFKFATWELQFRNFRHIFGRGLESGRFMVKKIGGQKSGATVPLGQVFGFQRNRGF
jgi:hypothetical protein